MAERGSPKAFEGEALILLVRLSMRLRFLAAFHHLRSPAGPSVELVAGELGLPFSRRRGLTQTTLAASGGLVRPGQPRVALKWWAQGPEREVIWEERQLRIRAHVTWAGLPVRAPSRLLHPGWPADADQRPPRLPVRLHRARVEIEVPRDDPLLGWLGGRCPGLLISTTARVPHTTPSWAFLPRPAQSPAVPEPG